MSSPNNTNTTTCSFIMVEHKHCVYDQDGDDEIDPPLVHVILAPDTTNNTNNSNTTFGLDSLAAVVPAAAVMPSAPPESMDDNNRVNIHNTTTRVSTSSSSFSSFSTPSAPPQQESLSSSSPMQNEDHARGSSSGMSQQEEGGDTTTFLPEQDAEAAAAAAAAAHQKDLWKASGTAGAILGLLLGGPVLAVVAGIGSMACAATPQQEGTVTGDISRALGEVALAAHAKWKHLNQKHHIKDKVQRTLLELWEHAKDVDRKHHVVQHCKSYLFMGWTMTVNYLRRQDWWSEERLWTKIENVLQYAKERFNTLNDSSSSSSESSSERMRSGTTMGSSPPPYHHRRGGRQDGGS